MRIEEVGKKIASPKGMMIIGGGFLLLFLISLANQGSKDAELEENVSLTGAYASYPDVATNADVVISTLQDSLDFQTEELSELMQGNFDATNDYIKEGIETNTAIAQITHADIMQGIDDLSSQGKQQTSQIMNHVSNESSSIRGSISSAQSSIMSQMDRQYADMQTSIAQVGNSVDVARSLIVTNAKAIDRNNVNLKSDIIDLKSSINQIGKTSENFSIPNVTDAVVKDIANSKQVTGSPAKSNTITMSSGVDVFAPSVYYE